MLGSNTILAVLVAAQFGLADIKMQIGGAHSEAKNLKAPKDQRPSADGLQGALTIQGNSPTLQSSAAEASAHPTRAYPADAEASGSAILPMGPSGILPVVSTEVLTIGPSGVISMSTSGVLPVASSGVLPVGPSGILPVASTKVLPVGPSGVFPVDPSATPSAALEGQYGQPLDPINSTYTSPLDAATPMAGMPMNTAGVPGLIQPEPLNAGSDTYGSGISPGVGGPMTMSPAPEVAGPMPLSPAVPGFSGNSSIGDHPFAQSNGANNLGFKAASASAIAAAAFALSLLI